MDDFVKVRKGTDTLYAMKKATKMICDFIKSNGKNLKQEHGFTINIQNREYD